MVPNKKAAAWPIWIAGCCVAAIALPVIVLVLASRGTVRKWVDIVTPRSIINRDMMRQVFYGMPEKDLLFTLGKPDSTHIGVNQTTGKPIVGREYVWSTVDSGMYSVVCDGGKVTAITQLNSGSPAVSGPPK